jgi:hypothetical protein
LGFICIIFALINYLKPLPNEIYYRMDFSFLVCSRNHEASGIQPDKGI